MGLPLPLPGTMGHCGIWHGGWGRANSLETPWAWVMLCGDRSPTGESSWATDINRTHEICYHSSYLPGISLCSSVVQRKSGLVRVFIFLWWHYYLVSSAARYDSYLNIHPCSTLPLPPPPPRNTVLPWKELFWHSEIFLNIHFPDGSLC